MSNLKMKSSGIDWIGDIPAHWAVKRVKDISKIRKGKAVATFFEKSIDMLPSIDTNFLRGRDNVVYCSSGVKVFSEKVLILWDGANAGELFFNKNIGYLGSTFGVFNTKLNNSFWFYYLKGIEKYSRDNLTGMGIPHVDGNVLKQTIALVPPKDQQVAIANYLDIETLKIDRKISILEQKFDKLENYKQSVIFETVTKGLDGKVAMKNSGIDWIGEIPEHWEVRRIKDMAPNYLLGVWGDYSEDNNGIAVLRSTEQDINGTLSILNPAILNISNIKYKNKLKNNDLLLTKSSGSKEHVGKCSYITTNNGEGYCFSNFMMGIRFSHKKINTKFLYYCINNIFIKSQINNNSVSITLNNLTNFSVGNLYIVCPPITEQHSVSLYLDNFTLKIDKKKEIIKKQMQLLQEYKQSIIFEAVTGKMEIL